MDGSAPDPDRPGALLLLATGWLDAEAASVREPGRVELEQVAVMRATRYEEALARATPENVRLAWVQAVVRQAHDDIGSAAWAAAGRVVELLRLEEALARSSCAAVSPERAGVARDLLHGIAP